MFVTLDRKQSNLLFSTKWIRRNSHWRPFFFCSFCLHYVRLCVVNLQCECCSFFFSAVRRWILVIFFIIELQFAWSFQKCPMQRDVPYDSTLMIPWRSNVSTEKSNSSPLSLFFILALMASEDEILAAQGVTNFLEWIQYPITMDNVWDITVGLLMTDIEL